MIRILLCLSVCVFLASCAGPNGTVSGTHRGGTAKADIFSIPLPY